MCLLRNHCWTIVTSPVPAPADQTDDWKLKDNWARGEIRPSCEADAQEIILDSKHACDSWTLLRTEFCTTGELRIKRLKREFTSVVMTETFCNDYIIKRVSPIFGSVGRLLRMRTLHTPFFWVWENAIVHWLSL